MDSRKMIGFGFLRKCGAGVMHLFVVTMCLGLSMCNIYGAHYSYGRWNCFFLFTM
ncbi:Palmitoyltransferase_ZDHHC2/15/20 [Hexamita inflata]|uniref:Palmitoyltransferase ZDHHC2/15/20 n=1 Tax=Hexamita inflata TaxID=28002 RepID=A0AA86Q579_9EUKA|nr:Palmitoyltransferase ZDHHC2/15/20 [Hexamita inflata]